MSDRAAMAVERRGPLYTPPYPARPSAPGSSLGILWAARRNMIAVWPDSTFQGGSFSYKILRRRLHVLTTPDAVKQVFVDGGATFEPKTPQQRNALAPLVGDGLIISDGETWRARRRVVAPATHISRLPDLAPAITAGAATLLDQWLAREGEEVDVLAEMAELTAAIISAAILGGQLSRGSTLRLIEAFGIYQSLIGQVDILSFLGLSDWLPRFQGLRARRAARRIHAVLNELIDDNLKAEGEGASLLRSMTSTAGTDGAPLMDRLALRNEAAVLFLAGHETTANTLAWAWFILSQDPESERRLHAEVDAVLGNGPAVHADFEKLPFTRAVVEEVLRLYPPVPLQGRVATKAAAIGGTPVAKGELVVLNAWIMHRHRDLWSDPDAFCPDRFLPGGTGAPSRYAYVPFSIGPRTCTGAAFAILETVLCLATLARRVRLRLRPGFVVRPSCRLSLRPGDSMPMTIERR